MGIHLRAFAILALLLLALPLSVLGQEAEDEVYKQSPWWPYLTAHIDDEDPIAVRGGPISVRVVQEDAPAFWVFPGPRELDPTVFGTPEDPKGTELPALFLGVPTEMREVTDEGVYQTTVPTPFGDQFAALQGADLRMTLVNQTAVDAATTEDRIDFEATFPAPNDQGEYRVVVTKPAPHGWAIPTGGGVVTNVFLHGVTGWGTRLMPTEFAYAAFWGAGDIYKDGELIAENWPTHVMLTEMVREEPYDLVFDENVNPDTRHLHLMVLPFTAKGEPNPLPSGFTLPNGQEQPFLHVMFPALEIETGVAEAAGEAESTAAEASNPEEQSAAPTEGVTVQMLDIDFDPAQLAIPANTDVPVTLRNTGNVEHNFSVDPLDIDVDVEPGATKTITINAEPGEYTYYCDVPGHKEAGMVGTMTVR